MIDLGRCDPRRAAECCKISALSLDKVRILALDQQTSNLFYQVRQSVSGIVNSFARIGRYFNLVKADDNKESHNIRIKNADIEAPFSRLYVCNTSRTTAWGPDLPESATRVCDDRFF